MPRSIAQSLTCVALVLTFGACAAQPSAGAPTVTGYLPTVPQPPSATTLPTSTQGSGGLAVSPTAGPPSATTAASPTTAATSPTGAPRAAATPSATATVLLPTVVGSPDGGAVFETFDGDPASWRVQRFGAVSQSTTPAVGNASARVLSDGTTPAGIVLPFSDAAASHQYEERPGTFHWQRAQLFVPASTVNQLGDRFLTIAALSPATTDTHGWTLRLRAGGALSVYGFDSDGKPAEVNAYGTLPLDRWVTIEVGLHSQLGPGVKRAFAVVIDGNFYGWFRQGRMTDETYSRAAFGVLTNPGGSFELFIDQWGTPGTERFPTGPDSRATTAEQEQDFRTQSGVQVQYDWSTWKHKPTLDPVAGLYTPVDRLQAGRNIDRMPELPTGWAEIEISWPNGAQPPQPSSEYFGPMVGFRKEVNREENLEIIPYRDPADGKLYLVFEVWDGGGAQIKARWPLPDGAVPGDGDIIRARWDEVGAGQLHVRASYYDASRNAWNKDVIDWSGDLTRVPDPRPAPGGPNVIDFFDGFHLAASITIDSSAYGIKRFKLGTLASYPA
jgi:hypothetical protein